MMTVKELSQLYYLTLEIGRIEKTLKELENGIGPGTQVITGMPHSANRAASATERLAVKLADLRALIAERQARCVLERDRLEQYIQEIPDSLTRAVFELRFAECLSWPQVADSLGGGNTAEGVKKRCYRYLRAEENNQPAAAV